MRTCAASRRSWSARHSVSQYTAAGAQRSPQFVQVPATISSP
ncbi:MAG: hypothetical protein RJA36_1936, partial [Pseudomonadota bacterium]